MIRTLLPILITTMTSTFPTSASLVPVKTAIRAEIKNILKSVSNEELEVSSDKVIQSLYNHPAFLRCSNVCFYLSMPSAEVQTYPAIQHALAHKKRVFIPKVTGKMSPDMVMFELASYDTIDTFPRSKWGIPEPPLEVALIAPDVTHSGQIELVIVPGVAFDSQCGRVGHGKGYYDCFLERVTAANNAVNIPGPVTIGLAFDQQIVDAVPVEAHDRRLDFVITPSQIYAHTHHQTIDDAL